MPAKIINISTDVSVNEGENVNLYCLAVGRPEPTITWKDQKCKPPFLSCLSPDPVISCSQLHLYLSVSTVNPRPRAASGSLHFLPSSLKTYQHSTHVLVFILPHSCAIIRKASCLVCPRLKFILPYFPYVPMFSPK